MLPIRARVRRDALTVEVSAAALVLGDILLLVAGNKVGRMAVWSLLTVWRSTNRH